MSDELIALRKFLDGSAPLDGYWFSEKRPDVPGAFWWRHDLTAIDRAAAELATLRATITRLEGERDRYRAALESVEQFFLRPGEDANEKFERIGDAFYRDTHMLRPGKDASWACQYTSEERDVAFNSWCAAKAAAARAALQEPKV